MSEELTHTEVTFDKIDSIAHRMIMAIKEEPVEETLFAAAMILGRLLNPSQEVEVEKEVKFVEHILEYASVYWAAPDGTPN